MTKTNKSITADLKNRNRLFENTMITLTRKLDEFFFTKDDFILIRGTLKTMYDAGQRYFASKGSGFEDFNEQYQFLFEKLSDLMNENFIDLIYSYLQEQIGAVKNLVRQVLSKNSRDSEKRTIAIDKMNELFRTTEENLQRFSDLSSRKKSLLINNDLLNQYRKDFDDLKNAFGKEISTVFRAADLTNEQENNVLKQINAFLDNCRFSLSLPKQFSERRNYYNFWNKGHHTTRFRKLLEDAENDFQKCFPEFIPLLQDLDEPIEVPERPVRPRSKVTFDQNSSDEINRLKARIKELEAELSRLRSDLDYYRKENGLLNEKIKYFEDAIESLKKRYNPSKTKDSNLNAIIFALNARLQGSDPNMALLSKKNYELELIKNQLEIEINELQKLLLNERLRSQELLLIDNADQRLATENKKLREENEKLNKKIIQLKIICEEIKTIKLASKEAENQLMNLQTSYDTLNKKSKKDKEEIENLKQRIQILSNSQKSTIDQYIVEIDKLKKINDQLTADKEDLQQQIIDLESEKSSFISKIQRCNDQISALQEEKTLDKQKITQLKEEKILDKKKISELEEEKALDKEKITQLEEENNLNKQQITQLEEEKNLDKQKITQLEEEIENLKSIINSTPKPDPKQITQLKDQIKNKDLQIEQLKLDIDDLNKKLEDNNQNLEDKEDEIYSKDQKIQELQTEIGENKIKIDQAKKKKKERKVILIERDKTIEIQIKQLQDKDKEIQNLKTEIDKLKSSDKTLILQRTNEELIQQNEESKTKISTLQKTIEQYQIDIERITEQNTKLTQEIQSLKETIIQLNIQIQDSKQKTDENANQIEIIQQLRDQNKTLSDENTNQTDIIQQLRDQIKTLSDENTNQTDIIQQLKERIKTLSDENQELINELDELKKSNDSDAKKQIKQLIKDKKKLETDNQELTDLNDDLTDKNNKLSGNNKKLTKANNSLSTVNTELNQEKEELSNLVDQLTKENEELKLLNESLTSDKDELNKQIKQLEKEIEQLNDRIKDLTIISRDVDLEKDKDKEIEKLNNRINELTGENDNLKETNDDLTTDKDQLTETNTTLTTLNDNLNEINKELQKENDDLKETNKKLKKENDDLNETNTDLSDKNDKLTDENANLVQQNKELTDESEDLRNRIKELEDERDQLKKEIEKLKEEIDDLKQKLIEKDNSEEVKENLVQIEKQKKKIKELTDENEELQKKNDDDTTQIDDLNGQIEELKGKIAKLKKEKKNLADQVNEFDKDNETLSQKVVDLNDKNNKLKKSLAERNAKILELKQYNDVVYASNCEYNQKGTFYENGEKFIQRKNKITNKIDMQVNEMNKIKKEYGKYKIACSSDKKNKFVVIDGKTKNREDAEKVMKKLKRQFSEANDELNSELSDNFVMERVILEEQRAVFENLYVMFRDYFIIASNRFRKLLNYAIKDPELTKIGLRDDDPNNKLDSEDSNDQLINKSSFDFYLKETENVLSIESPEKDYHKRVLNIINAFNREVSFVQPVSKEFKDMMKKAKGIDDFGDDDEVDDDDDDDDDYNKSKSRRKSTKK